MITVDVMKDVGVRSSGAAAYFAWAPEQRMKLVTWYLGPSGPWALVPAAPPARSTAALLVGARVVARGAGVVRHPAISPTLADARRCGHHGERLMDQRSAAILLLRHRPNHVLPDPNHCHLAPSTLLVVPYARSV